ncbi:MAG: SCP2 sterol-binding domain-containing protein [Thermoleophilaceae bacterium]
MDRVTVDRSQIALQEMAREEPELAARLIVQTLPAAARRIQAPLAYDLVVDGLGSWHVAVDGNGGAQVTETASANGHSDFSLHTDAEGLARLAAGTSALRLVLGGRLKIKGSRLKAMKLRAMSNGEAPSMSDAFEAGAEIDPDAIYRALPYLVDPEWTRGHSFTVCYEIDGVGRWYVQARDGERLVVSREPPNGQPDGTTRLSMDTYRGLLSGTITPAAAVAEQFVTVDGEIYPGTLLGRWIERSQGRDDEELERERRQRELQARRVGTWGGAVTNGTPLPSPRPVGAVPDQGDPAHEAAGDARRGGDLMSYEQLYALWERQNWKAHEIDFSVDREQWATTPREAQLHTTWSLGSFYVGEERVTADLAPFLMAAPSGEVEIFLSTQLVDEARHAAFFDRFGAEVMALDADDLRGRMRDLEAQMLGKPWHDVFDDGLRDVADRIKAAPDDIGLFVEGITTYHLIIEGVLAMTGQRFILQYTEDHGLYPGFQKGFRLVEQDEHRHIAFGVRFLRDAMRDDPDRFGPIIRSRVEELVPKALHVFVPPYAESAREFVSYGYRSTHIYGFAYRKLKRRMAVLGLEAPPPEELLPGPMASPEEARAAGAPV